MSYILPDSLSTSIRGHTGIVVRILGVMLLMPYRGRFMHPFAVAGLGFRYFNIISSEMYGHPLRKPRRVALRSLDILGLHNAWCWNFILFALVLIECANMAEWTPDVAVPSGHGRLRKLGLHRISSVLRPKIGNNHRSVFGSLCPRNIVTPLYIIWQ